MLELVGKTQSDPLPLEGHEWAVEKGYSY